MANVRTSFTKSPVCDDSPVPEIETSDLIDHAPPVDLVAIHLAQEKREDEVYVDWKDGWLGVKVSLTWLVAVEPLGQTQINDGAHSKAARHAFFMLSDQGSGACDSSSNRPSGFCCLSCPRFCFDFSAAASP
jgi:hypothetical protein